MLASACGGGDGNGSSSVESDVTSFFGDQNAFVEKFCLCFDDTPACRSDPETGVVSASTIQCVIDVANQNADAISTFAACEQDAWQQIRACSDALTCSSTSEEFDACFDAAPVCGSPPAELDAMFGACFPE